MTRALAMANAERELVRMCHSVVGLPHVHTQILRALRRILPVDAVFLASADPETLLFTGAFAEEPLDTASQEFLANEFGAEDVNRFSTLASADLHVSTLDEATRHDRPLSLRSREILRPLGLGDELRAALVADGQCWGYLCLHRDDRPLGFTSAEVAAVARVGPHIASALRRAVLLRDDGAPHDAAGPGVVLLAKDLSVVAISAEAEDLLDTIQDHQSSNTRPLPLAVYSVAVALSAVESGAAPAYVVPSARVRTDRGEWLELHASRLRGHGGEEQIAVVIEHLDRRSTVSLMLAAYRLSTREAEVAKLVLRGASTRIVADTLHISQHTVQDHLKAVFDKTGVNSRRELVAHLTDRPRADLPERGRPTVPGPGRPGPVR